MTPDERIRELEALLAPFAALAERVDRLDRAAGDCVPLGLLWDRQSESPTLGDCRRARAALARSASAAPAG